MLCANSLYFKRIRDASCPHARCPTTAQINSILANVGSSVSDAYARALKVFEIQ